MALPRTRMIVSIAFPVEEMVAIERARSLAPKTKAGRQVPRSVFLKQVIQKEVQRRLKNA